LIQNDNLKRKRDEPVPVKEELPNNNTNKSNPVTSNNNDDMFMTSANNDFQEQVYNDDFLMAQDNNDQYDDDFLKADDHEQFESNPEPVQAIKGANVDAFLGSIDSEFKKENEKEKNKVNDNNTSVGKGNKVVEKEDKAKNANNF